MLKVGSIALVVSLSLVACGGDKKSNKMIDAPVGGADAPVDAPRVCSSVTSTGPTFLGKDTTNGVFEWAAKVPAAVEGNDLALQYSFFATGLTGNIDLGSGTQANYKTCTACLLGLELDSTGNVTKTFFPLSGTLNLTADPVTDQHFAGSVSNLVMQEVMIASDYTSTPVANGACFNWSDQTIDKVAAPDAWTCTAPKFQDGTTCDCTCGTGDPDCNNDANAIMGCTTVGNRCFQGTCVTPPANDTCATAGVTLTVNGGAVTGSTKGAKHDYSAGLDGTTCTGYPQDGPDVAYKLTVTATTAVTITLTTTDTGFDPSIAVLGPGVATICDANPITTCVAGADANNKGMGETVTFTPSAAGDYYILVDTFYADGGGDFSITVTQ